MDTGDLVLLTDRADLRRLALLVRNNEEKLMSEVVKSEYERANYLKSVNDSHDKAMSLLDDSAAMHDLYAAQGGDKATIAEDVLSYVKMGINSSLQNIRNCCLRVTCIDKIRAHYGALATELADISPQNLPNLRRMAKDTAKFKECMWEYCNKYRSASARATSKAFSLVLKQEGITFPDLVGRHKNKLGYGGAFEDLAEAQKLEVYNSIIEESGRAKIPKLEVASTAFGVAVLLVNAGIMVWDIVTAEHKAEAVLRTTMTALSAVGAFAVQVAVETAVAPIVVGLEVGGLLVVTIAGLVAGMVAGLIFTALSGLLIDLILGTGGAKPPPVTDLNFHTATMPDGMAFANEIAHA